MLNFGLHGNSTRSSMMKTPLMFGQTNKLRDVKPEMATNQKDRQRRAQLQHQNSLYSKSSHMFSPQSALPRGTGGVQHALMQGANKVVQQNLSPIGS